MSLINDALKKAQKQRTGDSPALASLPSIGGDSAAKISQRSKPAGFNALRTRVGVIGLVLGFILIGGYFGMRALNRPSSTPPPAKPAIAVEAGGQPPVAVAPTRTINTPAPAITFNLAIAAVPPSTVAAPTEAAAAPVKTPEPKPTPTTPPVATSATTASSPTPIASSPTPIVPAGPAPKLAPRAIAYIEGLRIAGIRASATDSKVLMSDRVYRNGDIVEHELGLKLISITSNSLTFEDEQGGRYTRNF